MDADSAESVDPRDGSARLRRALGESRVRFRLDEMVGMTVDEARAVVQAAGGVFATDDQPITAKFDPRRVVASTGADGRITRVTLG